MTKLLVFTDLDGTLLDHHGYAWISAGPALKALKELGYPVIFNSSKTIHEMIRLSEQMGMQYSMIAENGSVVAVRRDEPGIDSMSIEQYDKHYFAKPYQQVVEIVKHIRNRSGFHFTGFSDMDAGEISELTGLPLVKAIAASKREATEPVLWSDSDSSLELFREQLAQYGLRLVKGGRFYHVMTPVDKAYAMKWLLNYYRDRYPAESWLTAGLGDSDNDLQMLEAVDFPVLVNNTEIIQPDVSHINRLLRTSETGSAGWNQAIFQIIRQLNQE